MYIMSLIILLLFVACFRSEAALNSRSRLDFPTLAHFSRPPQLVYKVRKSFRCTMLFLSYVMHVLDNLFAVDRWISCSVRPAKHWRAPARGESPAELHQRRALHGRAQGVQRGHRLAPRHQHHDQRLGELRGVVPQRRDSLGHRPLGIQLQCVQLRQRPHLQRLAAGMHRQHRQ